MSANVQTMIIDGLPEFSVSEEKLSIVKPFEFQEDYANEFVFFLKPECFNTKNHQGTDEIIKMIFSKFNEHNCIVSGAAFISGEMIDTLEVMDKHYGYINKMSKNVSAMLTGEEKQRIGEALGIANTSQYQILGGHEFLQANTSFNPQTLDNFWKTKKSIKLRSGLYFQTYKYDQTDYILINGFHPLQLEHYTDPKHKILLMLLQSNQSWKILKDDLSGDTFPERANIGSIRAEILANKDYYQVDDVSVANNFIHLSAGPFEGMFEIQNFLGSILGKSYKLENVSMARKMLKRGISTKIVNQMLSNPEIKTEQGMSDLFTLTENMNTQDAIEFSLNI